MNIDLSEAENPCPHEDHDWKYDSGDSTVGINGGWVCTKCGALNDEPAPSEDYPE